MTPPVGRVAGWLRELRDPRSLGAKLVVILLAVGLLGSLGVTGMLAGVIVPSFDQLETQAIDGHVERTRATLREFVAKVENSVRDYGDWNSSYDYMAHQTAAFEAESFSPLAMDNLEVNGMAYVAPDGHVVIARWHGPDGEDAAMRDAFRAADRTDRLPPGDGGPDLDRLLRPHRAGGRRRRRRAGPPVGW